MGSNVYDEQPVHEVNLAAYSIDIQEVTVASYEVCYKRSPKTCTAPDSANSLSAWGREPGRAGHWNFCNWMREDRVTHPINCVDWDQATAYCAFAGKRLPTEEEQKYAARGTDERTFPWGNTPRPFASNSATLLCVDPLNRTGTCAVGSFPGGASAFGVLDMAGNVWEWTASRHCQYPHTDCSDTARVLRGGGWTGYAVAPDVRATSRGVRTPSFRDPIAGFRCAKSD